MWEKGTLLFCKLDSYHFKTSVFTFKRLFCFMSGFEKLTLFDMGGGGGGMMAPPKYFWLLCSNAYQEEA